MASKLVNGRRVITGSEADPGSRKFLRKSGGRQVTLNDGTALSAIESKNYGKTPTVISNTEIIENRIPEMNSQVAGLPVYTPSNQMQDEQEDNTMDFLGMGGSTEDTSPWGKLRKRQKDREMGTLDDGGDDTTDRMFSLLDSMKETSDQYTRDQISLIEKQANRQRAKTMSATGANVQAVRNALFGAGAHRTGSGPGAIMSAELAGVEKLADIDEAERNAVSEARLAQQNGDYKRLEQQLSILEDIRQEKSTAFEEAQAAQTKASRDNAIAGLIAQGITDPVDMLEVLNGDGQGDFTIEEVTGALKSLTELRNSIGGKGAFKLDNKAIGQLLGVGLTSEDITALQTDLNSGASITDVIAGFEPDAQAQVRSVLGVPQGAGNTLTPGLGAATGDDEFIIRQRLFPKLATILNKGQLSDSDREVITETISSLRDMGRSEQQILDIFSGWSSDVNSPYNQTFRDIVLTNAKTGEGIPSTMNQVGSLIAGGSYKRAMDTVENFAMQRAKEIEPESYFGKAAADSMTTKIDEIKRLLQQGGIDPEVGFVEGNFQNLLGKLKGKDTATLKAKLTSLFQEFRRKNAGVAVTDSETKYLDPLFADITDPKGNFLAKLDAFQDSILQAHNATRSSVGLPSVRVTDILDPNERLNLYISDVYLPENGVLDL